MAESTGYALPVPTPNSGRNSGVDALRVIGISAVVFAHVVANPITHQWIYPWHVPIFFFLTGYFWTAGRPLGAEVRTRARTLLLPYGFWMLVAFAALAAIGLLTIPRIVQALYGGAQFGGIFGAYWFVTALFWTALLARVLERFPHWVSWAVALVGAALTFFVPLEALPLSIGHAAPALLFILAGAAARRHPLPLWAGAALVLAACAAVAFLPLARFDMKSLSLGTPVAGVVVAVAFSWGLTVVFSRLSVPGASFAASAGIAVVLLHTLPLSLLYARIPSTLLLLVVVFVGTWGAALLLRLTPLSLYATGVQRFRVRRPEARVAEVSSRN